MRQFAVFFLGIALCSSTAVSSEPVALRVESLMVPPSTQPIFFVQVKNLRAEPYQGTLSVRVPTKWRVAPSERKISLKAGELQRVPFTIEWGVNTKENSYPIEVIARGTGQEVVRRQNIVAASAPYFKPTIDGVIEEWDDSLPVAFTTGGKRSVLRTYWNRRSFSILIAVEEDALIPYQESGRFDAVQFAISPQGTATGTTVAAEASRFEFLLVAGGNDSQARCFRLASPGMKLSEAARCRSLPTLAYDDAKVAVTRDGNTTYYECSLPFAPMRDAIRPSEGRELFLSVLIHDPDGTGIRDWGQAAGLWPSERNRLAWSRFNDTQWGDTPPFDNKLHWGLCTSKY
ncbi:MAG TPA: hypothetical protein VE890_15735 [Thermoguttaceae bacterium]|nr:hypothetical protein [Thermoguttaceae bacterium]